MNWAGITNSTSTPEYYQDIHDSASGIMEFQMSYDKAFNVTGIGLKGGLGGYKTGVSISKTLFNTGYDQDAGAYFHDGSSETIYTSE